MISAKHLEITYFAYLKLIEYTQMRDRTESKKHQLQKYAWKILCVSGYPSDNDGTDRKSFKGIMNDGTNTHKK